MQRSVLHVDGEHTDALAILHEQIERKVLDEEVCVVAKGLAVKGVEDGVAGPIRSGCAAIGLTALAEVKGLTTESALVDLAFLGSRKRDTKVLKLRRSIESKAGDRGYLTSMTVLGASRHM